VVLRVQIPGETLDRILLQVSKPARYVGQEWNSVAKDWQGLKATMALAYPDLYELGMSNLGLSILYDLVNQQPDYAAERVFAPWPDMEQALRGQNLPLYSLETRHALADFDVIGFTLQTELTYTNVLNMLALGDVPVLAAERTASDPLVIAGGSCTYNPEPMTPFIDVFAIGEGEEVLLELLAVVAAWRARPDADRHELLAALAAVPGLYVPAFYTPAYDDSGAFAGLTPVPAKPATITKRIVRELPPALTRPVVPHLQAVHDRAGIEIQRGCTRGCRFCQAGIIYRPIRERPVAEVLQAIDELIANTGYDEVGLVSLSSSDHSGIAEIVSQTLERHTADGVGVSLPSLRIDSFAVELARMISGRRKTGFTFAPEAGSQRLRDVINKGVSEQDLLRTAEAAFASGWNRIKLYFMLGLPSETDEDILEIARLCQELARLGRQMRGRRVEIGISVATFVPKPHTPFQWEPLASREVVVRRQRLLREALRSKTFKLSYSDWQSTWLEALLARGDRRLGTVIHDAWRAGARFDAWSEHLRTDIWEQALSAADIDLDAALHAPREQSQVLPWSHIDVGVEPSFLRAEYERALRGDLSPDCRGECYNCGILATFADERETVGAGVWGCP
jgi:radical SAM family uncharacterized protein